MTNLMFTNRQRQKSNTVAVKSVYRLWAMFVFSALLSACANEQQLPNGAVMSISPPERNLTVGDRSDENGICFIDPESYIDWPVVISLTNAQGAPMGDQDIRVYVDFAENNYSGYPVMALYDDRRGNFNGVVDDFELVSGAGDDIAIVKSDRFGGDRELLLRINTSCPFRGEVFAFTQGVSARSTIQISVESDDGV